MSLETILIIASVALSTVVIVLVLLGRGGEEKIMKLLGENARTERSEIREQFSSVSDSIMRSSMASAENTRREIESLKRSVESSKMESRDFNSDLISELHSTNDVNSKLIRKEISEQFLLLNEISTTASRELVSRNNDNFEALKKIVEDNLSDVKKENGEALSLLRNTVETGVRESVGLGIEGSFKNVSEQLEQVYASLAEMKMLTDDITDLKRVLGGIKTRGTWGEAQLDTILSDILPPSSYEREKMLEKGKERVDFAIRIPTENSEIYLPVDSKFPMDKYTDVLSSYDRGSKADYTLALSVLKNSVFASAKSIAAKYIVPGVTTDFAVMFVPSEGLYALLCDEGAADRIKQRYNVILSGPSTFTALLSSLEAGFRSVLIKKNSDEIAKTLGRVKKSFEKFMDELKQAERSLASAQNNLKKVSDTSGKLSDELNTIESIGEANSNED